MPVSPTYPGVYVEELPSGVHTITGVSTAVTAFLGSFAQGPMNTPTQLFSVADLERNFGSLSAISEAGYAVNQFFANGGAEAWVVRVAAAPAPGTPGPVPANQQPPQAASIPVNDGSAALVMTVTAASPGQWGNSVRLAVDNNATDPTTSFNLTVTQVDSSTPPIALTTEVYRNLTLGASDPNNAAAVVNAASALIQITLNGTPTTLPKPTGTVGADISALAGTNLPNLTSLAGETMAVSFGGTNLTASPNPELTFNTAPGNLTELAATLQSLLRGLGTPPAVPNATVALIPGAATAQHLQISAATAASPAAEWAFTDTLATTLGLDLTGTTLTNAIQYALAGGSDGKPPNGAGLMGDQQNKTGIYALANTGFNILCLPDLVNLPDGEAFAVISAAETFCQSQYAFLLVDAPQGGAGEAQRDSLTGIQAWLAENATLRSSYAALYFPRPLIPDPLNGYRLRPVGPSGTIAGLYARTDGQRGVWKAPAGTAATLTNVAALNYLVTGASGVQVMTDPENGVLNPLAINCLRSLAVYGNVGWGARTLDGADQLASDWKYIPVRRLALYIEASLYQGTQWVVFEPNDEPLWSQIRLNVGTFMQGLFQQGAFQGSTPKDAYFVRCDSTTTTQADIDLGKVNILVGFAPLKPAEFVILQIQQIANQGAS
ncbi:MAG: phage tail sheath C-terminal domain-containing protein [Streptosporangiaceae bacterium]|jgi:phage tail sheath protein FI